MPDRAEKNILLFHITPRLIRSGGILSPRRKTDIADRRCYAKSATASGTAPVGAALRESRRGFCVTYRHI